MSRADLLYRETCARILREGVWDTDQSVRPRWADGSPAHTVKCFGVVNRYDLQEEFPLMTLRRTYWRSCVEELLWIWQKKSNNVHDLGSHIWDSWADESGSIGKAYGYQLGIKYRFPEGELAGQSFGNLFLAALNGIMPSFDRAVESLSQVLAITGRVLPVTNENIQLEAEFENGVRVVGESRIFQCKQEQDCRIRRVNLLPSRPKALPEAVEAIREAEMVVLAPGSLYTSIIPNLLVDGIVEAIRESRALKIYVCNVMTQEGETEGYTASDHIRALFNHSCPGLFDLCLVNDAPIPPSVMRGYTREGAEPILCDRDACEALGVEVITRPVSTVENGLVRHNPGHLAWELVRLHAQRNIRLVEDSLRRTPRNRVEK